jgi:hypothetical protein
VKTFLVSIPGYATPVRVEADRYGIDDGVLYLFDTSNTVVACFSRWDFFLFSLPNE